MTLFPKQLSFFLLLTVLSLTVPLPVVHAQETAPVQNGTVSHTLIPISLFTDETGGILGITLITDDAFLWAYSPSTFLTLGNVTTATTTYSWDYQNRLTQAAIGGTATTTNTYDYTGQRIKYAIGTQSTSYPTQYYNTDGSTITKHIFTPDGQLTATVTTTSGGTATSTGFKTAGKWTNFTTTRIGSSDNSYATCTNTTGCDGDQPALGDDPAKVSNFSFGISTSTAQSIQGIEVALEASCSGSSCSSSGDTLGAVLSWDGGSHWTATSTTSELTTTDAVYTLGGSSSTWGRTWSPNDFSSSNFMMKALGSCGSGCSSSFRKAQLDQLQVKVYYTTQGTATTTISFIHTDHLGGTGVVTDSQGNQVSLTDYYPYGGARIDQGSVNEQRKFTGHEYDADTALTYTNARYYNQAVGRFISQDPVFLLVGDKKFDSKFEGNWRYAKPSSSSADSKLALLQYLSNPQNLNSYSYVLNNPLIYTDPTGELFARIGFSGAFGPFVGSTGLAIDNKGINFYYSAGVGFGLKFAVDGELSSGDLSHKESLTVSRSGSIAGGAGLGGGIEGLFDPTKPFSVGTNPQKTVSVQVGLGAEIKQEYIKSYPIINFGSLQTPQPSTQRSSSMDSANSSVLGSQQKEQFNIK